MISIKILELMAMVVTAYVMVVMRGDCPEKKGARVLMRGDNSSSVQRVINCNGEGREEGRTGALMKLFLALETEGMVVFVIGQCM